ncbi:MAG: SUMF1/EgtB/PvdO family nonheme iron enzyme [Anaerolineae bacterium]|nr:SUMF1/EgtB/PvdO family nonheme iron enzyme [Anaerolineae bacterium]
MPTVYWNDRPILHVDQDRFDFFDYADALSTIILKAHTPITIGLFGPWGSGKTSLMRLLATNLLGRRTEDHRRALVIWFNAWQYERDGAVLWRSLLLRVLEGLKELDLVPEDGRRIEDWETRLYAALRREEQGFVEIAWPRAGVGTLHLPLSLAPSLEEFRTWLETLEGNSALLDGVIKAVEGREIESFRRQLTLLEDFQGGFAHLVNEYVWRRNGLLVICVDDLDRCLPDRALEVLETIKLFLDVPGCAFLLAADHQRIEHVVHARFGFQGEGLGESYLEKMVQLPFYLPPLEEKQIWEFVSDAAPDLPNEVLQVFSAGLAPNPRMVKRTLNIFNLLSELSQKRIRRGALGPMDLSRLAKIVVIQARFAELYHDLLEYPNLIQELELAATGRKDVLPVLAGSDSDARPLVERYAGIRPLMRMLRVGASFANLTPVEVRAYLHLVRPLTHETGAETTVPQRLFDDLVSNDLTRIRSAVGVIRQREQQREYATALSLLLAGERPVPWYQCLSSGLALGYLGDSRDLDAVIEIPGGEFRYGVDGVRQYQAGYGISKHAVTNVQYAHFLDAHPHIPAPYVNAAWARPFNWDPAERTFSEGRANFPVVLVTWEEAQAYCAWKGGRLPTEMEWERAARGDDGRLFPWGSEVEITRANVRETGIGSLTPVGVFLEGISPYGLFDMAGNVWEWMARDLEDGMAIIRGGAWNVPLDAARSYVRELSRIDIRSRSIGFRVAFDV